MSRANPPSNGLSVPHSKFADSSQTAPGPFQTPFDDADEEDDWWEDEGCPVREPAHSRSGSRTIPVPSPAGQGAGPTINTAQREIRKHSRGQSVRKPIREKSKHRQKKQNAAAGIKINTDFSLHRGPPPVAQQSTITTQAPANLQPGCFIDLAALNALDDQVLRVNDGLWKTVKRLMPNKNNQTGSNDARAEESPNFSTANSNVQTLPIGRLSSRRGKGHLPAPLRLEADLSPADRPIVIGISIPSARLAQHVTSPQTAASDTATVIQSANTLSPDYRTPQTPAIIVTPSREPSTWSRSVDFDTSPGFRRRATSVVHSRGTTYSPQDPASSVVPPVPQIPTSRTRASGASRGKKQASVRSSTATVYSEDENRKSRMPSSYTVFEEDESPILARRGRAKSVSTANIPMKHTSTIPELDQRESTGWWNHILTPFLSRSNTIIASPRSATKEHPAISSLASAPPKSQGASWDISNWEKTISPASPLSSTTIASDAWWDNRNTLTGSKKGLEERESVISPETESGTLPFMLATGDLDAVQEQNGNNEAFRFERTTEGTESTPEPTTRSGHESSGPPSESYSTTSAPVIQPRFAIVRNQFPPPRATQINHNIASGVSRPSNGNALQTTVTRDMGLQPELQTSLHEEPQPPPYSPPRLGVPRYRAVFPPGHLNNLTEPLSPTPLSPGLQQAMGSTGAIPLSEIPLTTAPRRPINLNSGYPGLPARPEVAFATTANYGEAPKKSRKLEARRQRYEKEDVLAHQAGGLWRGRGCVSDRGCYGRSGPEGRKRRRWYFGLCAAFFAIVILTVVLAMTLHRSTSAMEQSQWLNLTTFPPIFTGVSTVAYPENTLTMSGCADPSTSWSCILPPDLQQGSDPNLDILPNFRMQIQWDTSNSTNATPSEADTSLIGSKRSMIGNPVSAGHVAKTLLLKARDIMRFVPNPPLPSELEQFFLGNTTDNITSSDKSGERTPFYISFLSTSEVLGVQKREAPQHKMIGRQNSSTDPFPDLVPLLNSYFPPDVEADLTPAAANLVPFPTQQRIRLYDRGLESEHYGFYTYFNRSIFLKDLPAAGSPNTGSVTPLDDDNGGATLSEALYRCTWSETRFLVQMWTRKGSSADLLGSRAFNATIPSTNETANNFQQPGSFPYPTTITIDRHGGMAQRKEAYCYGIVNGRFNVSDARLLQEKKTAGGTNISPAPGLLNLESGNLHSAFGGFDGGTGGCSCQWANWLPKQ